MRPLDGIKVIEMAGLAPSPYCGMLLADFGADVVIVDRLSKGAPEIPNIMEKNPFDRGKRSMRVNLKTEQGIEIVRKNTTLYQDEDALSALEPGLADRLRANLPFDERIISEFEAGLDPIFYQAPVLVITHANMTITPCPLEDATLAAYHMMLMAQSLGLGTCYIGSFYEYANESQTILEALAIPPDNNILMAFTLGYPAIRFRKMVDRNKPEVQWIGWK